MPTYEYECKSCKFNFDFFQSMTDEPLKSCPKCNKELRRLIYGGTGIIFKGEGFYVTEKSGKAAGASKTPKPESAPKEGPCQGCPAAKASGTEASGCPKAAETQ